MLSDSARRQVIQTFKLLGDDTRLTILSALASAKGGEMNVTQICEVVGQSQPACSHHLALMRFANIIEPRRDGKHNCYRIVPGALAGVVAALNGIDRAAVATAAIAETAVVPTETAKAPIPAKFKPTAKAAPKVKAKPAKAKTKGKPAAKGKADATANGTTEPVTV